MTPFQDNVTHKSLDSNGPNVVENTSQFLLMFLKDTLQIEVLVHTNTYSVFALSPPADFLPTLLSDS